MSTPIQTGHGELMASIIKLENINLDPHERKEKYVEEYVCYNCRHLVEPTDTTCWQCGEKLEQSSGAEHFRRGQKLTEGEFKEALKAFPKL